MPRVLRGDGFRVLAVALAARFAMVAWAASRIPPAADGTYYHRLAERLASGAGYTWLWDDGAVTYAAHYPVGYPAAVALLYAAFGASPWLAMTVHALVGALAAFATQRLLVRAGRGVALGGGLAVALHPGLVAYTPALMTEGVAAALLACGLWAADAARQSEGRRRLLRLAACGVVLGAATLVRPQSLLLAPAFGALGAASGARRRALAGCLVTIVALACCLPWTLRNCARMGRCALVSVNGGWNLLIGTQPEGRGGWAPLETPASCREVFDEAEKDLCFERVARRRIAAAPRAWLALADDKLAVTFDYAGAAGWYLHEANPVAFPHRAKVVLGVLETAFERVALLLALVAAVPPTRRRRALAIAVVVLGAACALSRAGWLAHLALLAALAVRGIWRSPPVFGGALFAVGSVVLVHAVFFGAGRYQLLVLPFVTALAPLGWVRARRWLVRRRARGRLSPPR